MFNVVTGAGADVGTALAGHRDVDVVTFTGSTAVGRKVMAAAAVHGHRVQLELGGKAPFVVFDDADLDAAIQGAVAGSLINTGQDCTAATRAIVARELYDDFVAGVGEVMGKVVVGDPARPRHRPRPADLDGAPRQGGGHGRARARAGRPHRHRRQRPRSAGIVLSADADRRRRRATPRSTATRSSARC